MSKELEALILSLEEFKLSKTAEFCLLRFDREEALEMLKALTPNEQEVCEALGEYMNEPVWVDKDGNIRITTQWIAQQIYLKGKYIGINIHVVLPPHLIEMIGKFYEGKVKEND